MTSLEDARVGSWAVRAYRTFVIFMGGHFWPNKKNKKK